MAADIEYSLLAIAPGHPDAAMASQLASAAVKGDQVARLALADLLEEHGSQPWPLRDEWHWLAVAGDGSLNACSISMDGEQRHETHIGWHVPRAEAFQRMLDDAFDHDAQDSQTHEVWDDIPF